MRLCRRGCAALLVAALCAVLVTAAPAGGGTFPGTNGLIAFSSDSSIAVVNADGTGLDTIASGSYPSWSADGARIAYSRSGDLYIAEADGTNEVQLTSGAATDREPSWSPDGSKIAFMREEEERDIAVVDVASKIVTEIVTGDFLASHPAWSPDGSKIAYRSAQSGCDASRCIFLANPDGTGQTPLVNSNAFRAASQPSWSPDGTTVVFVYDDDPDPVNFSGGIGVVATSGGTPSAITDDPTTNDGDPTFSPDGTGLVYVRGSALIVAAADGSNPAPIPGVAAAVELATSWAIAVAPPDPTPTPTPIPIAPNFTG